MTTTLTDIERTYLLDLARSVIAAAVRGEDVPEPADPSPALRERRGAFVTLHAGDRLRGCIGYIEGVKPLADTIVDNALSAAFKDPRFPPVTGDELPRLHIEISALTPLRPVPHWRDIEIPRHGVVLTRGRHRSVFLPQVAHEEGWDRDTTLSHLAVKAGLEPDAWRESASFQVFEAEVFAEEKRP